MLLQGTSIHEPGKPPDPASRRTADGRDESFVLPFLHRLRFTRDAFASGNHALRDVFPIDLDGPARVVVFADSGVLESWPDLPERLDAWTRRHADAFRMTGRLHTVPGGERAKNDPTVLHDILRAIHDARICRRSYVLAIGGGAVLDAVGYAAAIAHRGVRLVRVPTTTLAQCDSGVGVKNGVNAFGKKNYLGTFAVPWAVVNDADLLTTLSDRDWRGGLSEVVKVALVKDASLFERVESLAPAIRARDEAAAEALWRRSAELHLEHVTRGGDPFELTAARPLDFGHWAAHRLETMTNFRLRHGEAVAIGVALDTLYSARIGLMEPAQAERVIDLLAALGLPVNDDALADADSLMNGLEEFREHLGGRLTVSLLRGVGDAVDVHEIDERLMRDCLAALLQRPRAATGSMRQ